MTKEELRQLKDAQLVYYNRYDGKTRYGSFDAKQTERVEFKAVWAWWGKTVHEAKKHRSTDVQGALNWVETPTVCIFEKDKCDCPLEFNGGILHTIDCPYVLHKRAGNSTGRVLD